jgi:5-methylcytosine-specific restriction endonuclease McrA
MEELSKALKIAFASEFSFYLKAHYFHWNVEGADFSQYHKLFGKEYDIDHIIPTSYAKTEEEMYLLNHWSNFQPLCSKVNRDVKKANVYPCTNLELGITFWEDRWEYVNKAENVN